LKVRRAAWIGLILWGAGVTMVGADLLASHLITLPAPQTTDLRLRATFEGFRAPEGAPAWRAIHALSGHCRCSSLVAEHLLARGAGPFAAERVLLVEGAEGVARALEEAGFSVEQLDRDQLEARHGIISVPLLIVADPAGVVRYAGGYTERKQGPVIHDREIFAALAAGEAPESLPTFGCAVSAGLARSIDPLGLRR
jgi:hypothetical protein